MSLRKRKHSTLIESSHLNSINYGEVWSPLNTSPVGSGLGLEIHKTWLLPATFLVRCMYVCARCIKGYDGGWRSEGILQASAP